MTDRRPRLLLVYTDSHYAAQCSRYFRRHGWDVHLAGSDIHAEEVLQGLAPTAVILDAQLAADAAAQICQTLTKEQPGLPVVMLAAESTPDESHFRRVGARAVVSRLQGVQGLAEQLPLAAF